MTTQFSEWTDEEILAEEKRLIYLHASVDYPYSPEIDAHLTRLLEVQTEVFRRAQRDDPSIFIFSPYYPLVIHRF